MIGKVISHYQILEELGAGGMGMVYKAQDTKLDRFVALKFLPPHLSQDEENKKRFIQEAKAASALNHPNIATIYEIDEAEGQMFIAMEYIEGQSLVEIIGTNFTKPLRFSKVIDYASQIAEGLAKAHAKGIVHRDIKPANILVTEDGVVKIVDFGLAKLAGRTMLTKEGTTLGTVAYMSPEQTQGATVDHRTDIWALGVVLYEMLTGQLPFKGDYEQAVVYSIMNEDPEPLTGLRTGVPMELERLVNKALAKNPEERYHHISEMLVDLRSVAKTQESKARQRPSQLKPSKKSRRLLYPGAFASLMMLILLIIYLWPGGAPETGQESIAVLPFVNMSPSPENEYFSDGITEELINALTKIKKLNVVARTSVFQFKGKAYDIREIGESLNVGNVLEGSVRKAGNQLRITAQLIKVADGYHVWSETYDREMSDVFAIQEEIAQTIVHKLKISLAPEENMALTTRGTGNLEAYNLYLKGRYFWNRRTREELEKSLQYFGEAIEVDPDYAHAYAGLADSYVILALMGVFPETEVMPQARTAANQALKLDSTLAEAHTSLAYVKMYYEWDWSGAEREFRQAIRLNPNYATSHHYFAVYLAEQNRYDEPLKEIKRALEFDPLSLIINTHLGWMFAYQREYDKAIAQYQKTLELDANFPLAYFWLGMSYIEKSMYEEAVISLEKAFSIWKGNPRFISWLGYAHGRWGKRAEALQWLHKLKQLSEDRYVSAYDIALIYLGIGDHDGAFEWLNKAYEQRESMLVGLKTNPIYDPVRRDARFADLLVKVGLEP